MRFGAPIQNGGLECVWNSTLNNGFQSYSFQVIKTFAVNYVLVKLELFN